MCPDGNVYISTVWALILRGLLSVKGISLWSLLLYCVLPTATSTRPGKVHDDKPTDVCPCPRRGSRVDILSRTLSRSQRTLRRPRILDSILLPRCLHPPSGSHPPVCDPVWTHYPAARLVVLQILVGDLSSTKKITVSVRLSYVF